MPRKQRTRLTGCTATHWERSCRICARLRAAKARRRPRPTEPLPRTEQARQEVAARAYVWSYLRRASITPATVCERCGAGAPVFFHPDPAAVREIVWLCKSCRKRVRATGEPVTLTWVWPGELGEPRSVVPVERPGRRPRRDRSSSPPELGPADPAAMRRALSAAELAAAEAAAEAANDERYRAQADAFAAIDALNARIAASLDTLSQRPGAKAL
jgi:hypothetical protein